MKKALTIIVLTLAVFTAGALAQDFEPEQLPFEKVLEDDAKHNLDVAWQYFKLKKAYKAALLRTEETLAAHPGFSKIDEVLYVAGMSSYYLAEGKGKQKIDLERLPNDGERERFAPDRLKEDAVAFLGKLVEEHPESKYADKAKETLEKLKGKD